MPKYKVAHINTQGVNLIIAPLESSFDDKPNAVQQEFIEALQACATSAGLAGTVVPVWMSGGSRKWICPQAWNPFFKTFDWDDIMLNLNIELSCG